MGLDDKAKDVGPVPVPPVASVTIPLSPSADADVDADAVRRAEIAAQIRAELAAAGVVLPEPLRVLSLREKAEAAIERVRAALARHGVNGGASDPIHHAFVEALDAVHAASSENKDGQ